MLKKILILTSAAFLGLIAGAYGGFLQYQAVKPSYEQFGGEFAGLDHAAFGALIGLVIFLVAAYLLFIGKK